MKWLAIAGLVAGAAFLGPLLTFRALDPPGSTLMLAQRLQGQAINQRWVPLKDISPHLVRAVIASEDGQFCSHRGIDFKELEAAFQEAEERGDDVVRGASTITMQVVKNLFLWPSRSLLRKGLELPMALAVDAAWPKARVLEVYLNIAEWGPGVFGAEAAARYHFKKPASRLTPQEAALLAVSLPNPIERNAGRPGPGTRRLASIIEKRVPQIMKRAACVPGH